MRAIKRQGIAMVEDAMIKKNVWSYSDKPGTVTVTAAAMAIFILATIMLFNRGFTMGALIVLLPAMLAAWSFSRVLQSTTIEIDLDRDTVSKREKLWFSEKISTYPLRNFSEVKISRQSALAEEGYGVVRYGIALEGSEISLDVYSTENEQQSRMIQQMLMEHLSLSRIGLRTMERIEQR
jgi:hypothetical protein